MLLCLPTCKHTVRRIKQQLRQLAKAIVVGRAKPEAYSRLVLSSAKANELISQIVQASAPALVGRIGATELSCLKHFIVKRQHPNKRDYPTKVVSRMRMNAGFFPPTEQALDDFCRVYLGAAAELDVLGVWYNPYEEIVANQVCPGASLVPLASLEPYYHARPWSSGLAGKDVLVMHPFADSIRENFERNRDRLFADGAVLPRFNLRVVKAVQSIAGKSTPYPTWFQALEHMKSEMDSIRFDVCIVGAGAYGLPLAAHAKRGGATAIHLGGATQLLFGIKGRRWDHDGSERFYNEWWVRPTPTETPTHAELRRGRLLLVRDFHIRRDAHDFWWVDLTLRGLSARTKWFSGGRHWLKL